MNRHRAFALWIIVALPLSLACSRRTPTEDVQEHPHEDHPHAEEPGHGGAGIIRIDPAMLRDLRVTTVAVEARSAGEGTLALGELQVNEDAYAEVGSPAGGRLAEVLVGQGAAVKAGQPMARLVSAALGRASAELIGAEARLASATVARDRKKVLAAEKVVPERELLDAEGLVATTSAEVKAARAELRALGVSDSEAGDGSDARLVLRAPIAGTVISRAAAQGAQVDADKTLFRVADLSSLWLIVHAFERDAVRVKAGSEARLSFPSLPGQTMIGTVAYLGAEVEAASRTVPVRIVVDNAAGRLRPGMSGSAWLTLGEAGESVVAVPARALQRVSEGWAVFVPRGEGAFEARAVGRGRDLGGEVEVLSGLRAGELVVVDGAFLLKAEQEKAAGGGDDHPH